MPEGPEVETIRRTLSPHLEGRTIAAVTVLTPGQIRHPDAATFIAALEGQRITGLDRRGKYLVFHVGGRLLVCHLRMSGRLYLAPAGMPLEPHTHVVFHLEGGQELRYVDPRKFGGFHLAGPGGEGLPPGFLRLGPDPIAAPLDPAALAAALRGRRAPIKALLLDQRVVAGIGNIYADEVLHRARIHPLRPAGSLAPAEVEALHRAIGEVLALAVARRGTTFSLYRDGEGRAGDMYAELQVFDRTGEPCRTCGTPIVKIAVAGRGTHLCPACQPPPPGTQAPERRPRPRGRRALVE